MLRTDAKPGTGISPTLSACNYIVEVAITLTAEWHNSVNAWCNFGVYFEQMG
jgi:hypothetical protein